MYNEKNNGKAVFLLSVARCEKTSIKIKLKSENTTKFFQEYKRCFEGEHYNHSAEDITNDIADCLKHYSVIIAENTKLNSQTVINTENEFVLWARNSGPFIGKMKVTCTYSIIDTNGDVSDVVKEFTWEDFYVERQETPMFELKIYDVISGKIIKSALYNTDYRLYDFLENNIEISSNDGNSIVYKEQNCYVEINGIDVSEYYTNREATKMTLSSYPYTSSSVSLEVTVDGLY